MRGVELYRLATGSYRAFPGWRAERSIGIFFRRAVLFGCREGAGKGRWLIILEGFKDREGCPEVTFREDLEGQEAFCIPSIFEKREEQGEIPGIDRRNVVVILAVPDTMEVDDPAPGAVPIQVFPEGVAVHQDMTDVQANGEIVFSDEGVNQFKGVVQGLDAEEPGRKVRIQEAFEGFFRAGEPAVHIVRRDRTAAVSVKMEKIGKRIQRTARLEDLEAGSDGTPSFTVV